jgi:glycosyltransferase involved in cell wall biosynthesis
MKISGKKEPALVTVGIPIYNDIEYASAAIGDILAQTYQHLEIIISDNCSTDGTEAICRSFASKDARIHYVRQEHNIGPHANFKYLIDKSSGAYFMWAASDDRWHPEFIERLVVSLESDPKAAVAFGPFSEIDERGQALPGEYRFDFSGSSAAERIIKFHLASSSRRDAFFYALFRKSNAEKMSFIKWWWFNKTIPMNNAYPPLSNLLAGGDYKFVEFEKPLWMNRVHMKSKPRHSGELSSWPFLFAYCAFLLRKLNQLYETVRSVFNGGGSVLTVIVVFPVLVVRCLYDCVEETRRLLLGAARRIKNLMQMGK